MRSAARTGFDATAVETGTGQRVEERLEGGFMVAATFVAAPLGVPAIDRSRVDALCTPRGAPAFRLALPRVRSQLLWRSVPTIARAAAAQGVPPRDESSEPADAAVEQDEQERSRPKWAPKWMPDWLVYVKDRPWLQLALIMPLYVVHLLVFSKVSFPLPKRLILHEKMTQLGMDSITGFIVLFITALWRKTMKLGSMCPNLLAADQNNPPWKIPREQKRKIVSTTVILTVAYIFSGYGALVWEQLLLALSAIGLPLTVPTLRAWKVLLGHLMWVYMGCKILDQQLKPFFPPEGQWLRLEFKENWGWWAIGGYYVSALLFNIADLVNQLVLPPSIFNGETVVSKLINPENRDMLAMAIGSIGPCVTAPVFEEVLYRGFLLPALVFYLPLWASLPISSVLFAAHHLNPGGMIPLTVLGLAWAILYTRSRNVLVTIIIHAMWNSRVFLGSLIGLDFLRHG
ncbi:hypothetical protein FVE85_6132 [Porphyridium purpureum]|uniref:CAAX prenyl protease 2/Lysostaphin resistance protein A-like domain-containing protein n=1 Tax=Porphyridium purpureum TaxID=35688 RepID=A0A5J4Z7C3_PORPP|nr:hypothetical protein FVE85_6132 [Porphyridium purpureum]|eukprot:POR2798..scf295_1